MTDSPDSPLLTAVGLCKTYGRDDSAVHAVAGIDLEILPGEFVAIMGASGSGKTTLLQLLGGLERLDAGSIHIKGHPLESMTDSRITALRLNEIGVVFQACNLMPTLTAIDNVALPLLLCGIRRGPAREAALTRLMEVGMEDRAGHRPSQLSGGEQQRVALARALINNPSIVLADEPTGSLDRRNSEAVCRQFRGILADSSRSLVVVTHEPAVAAHADRIFILSDGQVADHFFRREVHSIEEIGLRCLQIAAQPMLADAI